jgi:hypothetical protein
VELGLTTLAVGVLVVVALCGVVAITPTAVASGAVALPLGLGLAMTIALVLFGLAFRARMSQEVASHELFRLECARNSAAERERLGDSPYRAAPVPAGILCTRCLFDERTPRAAASASTSRH